jgi:predicted metal-dependent TIM-barrel fold hydrolase
MKLFDPHVHMTSRTTDDYQAMARANIAAVIEPAFWLGQPRTHVATFEDYFASLVGWERFRASQFGIQHFCTIALNPKEANDAGLAEAVMEILPLWLHKDGVVAVGEIGLDDGTAAEEAIFVRHLALAERFSLPILVHTPHRDKQRGTERLLAILREHRFEPGRVLIDHNTELTLPLVLDAGCWAGHSIYPHTKMDERRMTTLVQRYGAHHILVNSAADWGISDPLKVPSTLAVMAEAGIPTRDLEAIFWNNPVAFFGQSGRLSLADDAVQAALSLPGFAATSLLRGER